MGNYGSRVISGKVDSQDGAGYDVTGIGDFNGDGIGDFAITAQRGDSAYTYGTGSVYVVFGTEDAELTFSLDDIDGTNGFVVTTDTSLTDYSYATTFGSQIVGLGDVNGDGIDDFGIAQNATSTGGGFYGGYYGGYYGENYFYSAVRTQGVAYVIFGGQDVTAGELSVTDLDHVRLDADGEIIGMESLGDINGDGLADVALNVATRNTDYSGFVASTYLYDANENGVFDYDYDTNPNEYQNENSYYVPVEDVTGYIVYGTDQERTNFDPIANSGSSSVIVDLTQMSSDEGTAISLGQTHLGLRLVEGGGGIETAAFSASVGNVQTAVNAGIAGGVDIDGDGFVDIVASFGNVYVGDRLVVRTNNDYSYTGGVRAYTGETIIIDGETGAQSSVAVPRFNEDGIDTIAGLGNFSGGDAAQEIAIAGFGSSTGFPDADLPRGFAPGVYVLNGRSDFFDTTFEVVDAAAVLDGDASFFYSSATYVSDFNGESYGQVFDITGVLGTGDMTGDGIDDMLILVERYNEELFTHFAAYIVAGTAEVRSGAIDLDALVADGDAYLVIGETLSFDNPFAISAAGDVDGDGFADLLVGQPSESNSDGKVTVIHGGADALEAGDNADGSDDNVVNFANVIVDVDTGLVPTEISITENLQLVVEPDSGSIDMTFDVFRTGDLTAEVTVDWAVSGGGLTFYSDANETDFEGGVFPSGTATFASGEASTTITVSVAGDLTDEETYEVFQVVLSNPTSDGEAPVFVGSNDTGPGLIQDNDEPVRFSVFNTSATEGNPGDDVSLQIAVYRSGKTDVAATVDWTVTIYTPSTSISAEDEDFEGGLPQTGTVSFAAGQTVAFISLPILEDTEIEGREYVSVALSNPTAENSAVVQIDRATAFSFINNDDFPVTFAVSDSSVTETDDTDVTLTFTITRSGVIDADATVDFRLSANGATAADFTSGYIDPATGLPRAGTLTFAAGETTKTVSVQVAPDDLTEFTEYVYLNLTNPTTTDVNTPVLSDNFGIGSIFDDDPAVTYGVNDAFVTEGQDGAESNLTFTIYRNGPTDVAGTVDFSLEAYPFSNAATAEDFASGFPQSGTLSFAAGETTKTVTVVVADDDLVENTELVQVVLSNPTAENNNAAISDSTAYGYIDNDDIPVVFSASNVTVNEGDTGDVTNMTVRVFRSGDTTVAATLDYSVQPFVTSQAANDDDIEGSFPMTGTLSFAAGQTFMDIIIPITGDNVQETNEFIQVFFTNPTAEGASVQLNTGSVIGTILNDDVPVTFSTTSAQATEGQSGAQTPMVFTIFRGGVTDVEASVDYQISGYTPSPSISAESPDFAGGLPQTGTVTFAAGQTQKTITLQVLDDAVYEQAEYVQITLSNPVASTHPQGAQITNGQSLGTIFDDEIPVYLRVYGDTVTEGDTGDVSTLRFLVERTGDTTVSADVDYQVSSYFYNGATDADLAGAAPLPIGGTVSFAAGETRKFVEIDVAGDELFESTEYLQIDLSNASSGNPSVLPVITGSRAYGYINDDDIPTYFRVAGVSTVEGDTGTTNTMSFVVTRYGDTSSAASVSYNLAGGTVNAEDFVSGAFPTSGTLTFAAGQTSRTVTIDIAGDDNVESDEYTFLTLSNATSANPAITAVIATPSAYAYVQNDDFPAYISVSSSASANEGDDAADNAELTFIVYRSGDTSSTVTVDYDFLADGFTPVSADDFEDGLPQSGTLTFNPGETQKTVTFRIAEDEVIEGNERGRFVLSDAQVTSGDDTASAVITRGTSYGIIYNDDFPPTISLLANGSQWGTSVNEGNSGFTEVTLTFVRDGNLTGELTVNYELQTSGGVFGADSQDIEGFLPAFGQSVTFADGVGTATAIVRINGDGLIEANESFSAVIKSYSSSESINYTITNTSTSITIRNDDGRPPIPELPFDVNGDGVIEDGEFIRVEADVFGDPHITTLDGLGYDFQAVGEYVLVESVDGAENPFSVQVRFEAFPGSDLVSVTTRAAVEVKGKVVEIDAHNPDAPILVDGVAIDMAAAALSGIDLDGDTSNANDIFVTEDGKIFITMNDAGEVLMVGVMDGSLNVCVFLAGPDAGGNAGAVRGLMGNANQDLTDDFQMRDGSAIPDEAISFDDDGVPSLTFDFIYGFGDYAGGGYKGSWALADGESKFSGETPDYPDNFPAAPFKIENLPDSVREAAIAAAIAAGIDPETQPILFENAVLDFALTGNESFLQGVLGLAATPEGQSEVTEAPDLAPTVNVTATQTAITEGDSGLTEVTFTFYRLGGTNGTLDVSYALGGGIDADDLADDTPLSGTVSFADGEEEATLTVFVKGDLSTEANEALTVSITGTDNDAVLVGASQGTTTIQTDDFGPDAQDDAVTGESNSAITGNLLDDNGQGADTDPDDDNLTVTHVIIDGVTYSVADGPIDLGDGRVLSVGDDGNFQFSIGGFYSGLAVGEIAVFTFDYEVTDGNGGTDRATVTLSIDGTATPPAAPVAVDDSFTLEEDAPYYLDLLENDGFDDGDYPEVTIVDGPTRGTVKFDGEGWIYVPDDDYFGSDSLTYTLTQNGLTSEVATVSLTIDPVNDAPTAAADAVTVDENASFDGQLSGMDIDNDLADLTFALVMEAQFGTVTVNPDGSYTYTPTAGYFGEDSFIFSVTDPDGESAEETVNITVNEVPDPNTAPVATDFAAEFDEDMTASFFVTALVSDAENDPLVLNGLTISGGASVTQTGDLSFNVDPDQDFYGKVTVTYTVTDGEFTSNEGTIVFTINPVNDAPTFDAVGPFTVDENTTAIGAVSATDVDGDALTFGIVDGGDSALFTIDPATGALSFITAPDYESPVGGDNNYDVVVSVTDGAVVTTTGVTVSVADVDEAPDLIVVRGTAGNDVITGTDADEIIISEGGLSDRMSGKGGADTFDFTDTIGNGVRERDYIMDFDTAVDSIMLGADADFAVRFTSRYAVITDSNDGDQIFVYGNATNVDELNIVMEPLSIVL